MSQPSPSSYFQDLYNAALKNYENETGTKLVEHPLAKRLETCESPKSLTIVLQEQAQKFHKSGGNDGKIMRFLRSSVEVLYRLFNSTVVVNLVRLASVPFPPANAIFTGIAVLLATVKATRSSYDKLVVIFSSFDSFLGRLSIYIGVPPSPALTEILVKTIQELLSILALATKVAQQGLFKRLINKAQSEQDIDAALQKLDRLNLGEVLAVGAQNLEIGAQNLQIANEIKSDNVRKKFQEWLSPPDPSKNHSIVLEIRHPETGMWLVQGDTYREWKYSVQPSSLLWINGIPGAGKSFICSAVIEDIRALQESRLASLAFFYCDFRDEQKRDRRGLLSSLLVQLCGQSDVYSAKLSSFYEAHGRGSYTSDDELLGCLKDLLDHPEQATVHIIIDALDECPTTKADLSRPREKVLELVGELVGLQRSNLRICVTSRLEGDIESILGPLAFYTVSLEREPSQIDDITEYVRHFVKTDRKMQNWNDKDKKMVIDVLPKKANGVFRWVACQLENLSLIIPRTEDTIRRALDELPMTLDKMYTRTLEKIDERNWKHAHIFFQCVAVAFRPLHVNELAQFLSFNFDSESMDSIPTFLSDWRPDDLAHTVLSMCSSLLTLVKPDGYDSPIVQFAHFSAQEYLMSTQVLNAKDTISRFRLSMTPAHTIVARACLGILLHLDETVTKESLKSFPLAEYAAKYWVGHARIEDVSSKVQDGMKSLFDPSKIHFSVWVWIWDPEYSWWNRPGRSERPGEARATPLHYAAFCGLHYVAMFLIVEHSQDVNARGFDDKETPLHVASRCGHADIAQLLLEHDADVNAENHIGQTPLHLSSDRGHVEVARILLEHGADKETRDGEDGNPLELASRMGHMEVARLLLKYGADANTSDNIGMTPLHLVSSLGHVGVARALLEHGANVNARNADYDTPLHEASSALYNLEKRIDLIPLLIQHGSNIHAQNAMRQTPFMVAAQLKENDAILQLLLEYGAEDHRSDNDGRTSVL